jgi:hypothetical protein
MVIFAPKIKASYRMENKKRPEMNMVPRDGDMYIPKYYIKPYSHGEYYGVFLSLRPMQGGKEVPATLYRCTTQKLLSKKR